MQKTFNTTGTCIKDRNYMVNIDNKLDKIEAMVHRGNYFAINRPRQYGKTTTMYLLEQRVKNEYLVISCSFEGIGDLIFRDEEIFSGEILNVFADSMEFINEEASNSLRSYNKGIKSLKDVSKAITNFIKSCGKKVILFIDEVDKASNNQLFLSFLGVVRSKFLLSQQGKDVTFHSVILAGVHDIIIQADILS